MSDISASDPGFDAPLGPPARDTSHAPKRARRKSGIFAMLMRELRFAFPGKPQRTLSSVVDADLAGTTLPLHTKTSFWARPKRSTPRAEPSSPAPVAKPVETPQRAAIGWIDTFREADAIEAAKHFAESHFDAPALSTYFVAKYKNAYFWEVHQGGQGRAYLPNIISALKAGKSLVWFRVRKRAYTISWRDERPYCLLQPSEQSPTYFSLDDAEITPSASRMKPIVWRGGALLAVGVVTAMTGMIVFFTVSAIAAHQRVTVPEPPGHEPATMPSSQWSNVSDVPLDRYVEAQRFADGHWQAPILRTIARYRDIPVEKLDPSALDQTPKPAAAPNPATGRQTGLTLPLRNALMPHKLTPIRDKPASHHPAAHHSRKPERSK